MNFRLNGYNKNIGKDELLSDLKLVANKLNKTYLSRSEYEKNGKYSATPYIHAFGSWLIACEKAGLDTTRDAKDYFRITNDDLLNDMIAVAEILDKKTISTKEYSEHGRYKVQTIIHRFSSWSRALTEANLTQTNYKTITNKDLFDEIERLWISKGCQPTTTDIKKGLSKYSLNTYARRFGGWRNALEAFVEHTDVEEKNDLVEIVVPNGEEDAVKRKDAIKQKKHKTNRDINLRLRFKVMQRDNFKCCMCGASPAKDPSVELHIDHIKPWSKGGETVLENLQTLCSKCNLGKSDLE